MDMDVERLARALHRAHFAALDVLHGRDEGSETPYDLEQPERRSYLTEQARALLDAGWRAPDDDEPPGDPDAARWQQAEL
jgi:hypothetical protein